MGEPAKPCAFTARGGGGGIPPIPMTLVHYLLCSLWVNMRQSEFSTSSSIKPSSQVHNDVPQLRTTCDQTSSSSSPMISGRRGWAEFSLTPQPGSRMGARLSPMPTPQRPFAAPPGPRSSPGDTRTTTASSRTGAKKCRVRKLSPTKPRCSRTFRRLAIEPELLGSCSTGGRWSRPRHIGITSPSS